VVGPDFQVMRGMQPLWGYVSGYPNSIFAHFNSALRPKSWGLRQAPTRSEDRIRDIAVLTPYTGQLQKLREKMGNDFEIVLSERDQETLARDGFNEEIALSEGEQAGSGFGRKPLEKKKVSWILRMVMLRKEWYGEVTAEEITAIKFAMVRGPEGITARSGDWHNCESGHPVSLDRFPSLIISPNSGLVCNWRLRYANGASSLP
jgi:hypothetical protein